MKLSPEDQSFVDFVLKTRTDSVLTSQGQILQWRLNINIAGLAGALAAGSSVGIASNGFLLTSVIAFASGMLCMLGYSSLYFKRELALCREAQADAHALRTNEIGVLTFAQRELSRPQVYIGCVILARLSGIAACVGIISLSWVFI